MRGGVMQSKFKTMIQLFFRTIGALMIANAAWMAASAHHWFVTIPSDLAATGVANNHFIHDVAAAYLTFGLGLIWCASNLDKCRPVYLGVTFFMVAHGVSHILEMLFGQLPHSHWWIDFPLVFLPGILLSIIAIPSVWRKILN